MWNDYQWEYSPLARFGNRFWVLVIDPVLSLFADDGYAALRGVRGLIQVLLVVATLLLPVSIFFSPGHILTASGLLFDIAGILRLFLLEEINGALEHFRENKEGNLPSVAMRELIMPEASGPYDSESPYIKRFFYSKRGVFFLFIGFVLQMIGDLAG
jgi:hypothetical protein